MNYSHWEYDSYFNSIDLAIVGGGIVGLNAAIEVKRLNPSLKVMVLEKGVVLQFFICAAYAGAGIPKIP